MTNAKKTVQTIKHKGRKYLVIHGSVTLKLLKRAGKPHWFTLEDGKGSDVKRHKGFWEALAAYDKRRDELGLSDGAVAESATHRAAVAEFLQAELEVPADANA